MNQFNKPKVENRNLSKSSRKWVERHISDPYVHLARKDGYLSRAAYKLIEMQERFRIIKCANIVLDLGAAPGSWSQIVSKIVAPKNGLVVSVDLLPMKAQYDACTFIQGDCKDEETIRQIASTVSDFHKEQLGKDAEFVNVILSDMSPNMSGCKSTDHFRCMLLCDQVISISNKVLIKGGSIVMKFLQGPEQKDFLQDLKSRFQKVKLCKPEASRVESYEVYIVALGKI
jgi:23S rRNA (uridine2552-2'-O)-methyltransferase